MSSFLYRLGRACFRRHRQVLAFWLAVLAAFGVTAALAGGRYSDNFKIPGAASQLALDKLQLTFPQAAAVTAQTIIVLPRGTSSDAPAVRASVERAVKQYQADPLVDAVTSPYSQYVSGLVSSDKQALMVQLQLKKDQGAITDADRQRLTDLTTRVQQDLPAGSRARIGGQAYSIELPELSATEGAGLVVALVVLFFTLGSVLAAGLPLLTAVIGVAISMCLITVAARMTSVNSTTPMLAVMLGLAVGIDYALFILSRHREQLRGSADAEPLGVEESAAQSVATAGSAVVFAGLTVCIALVGLTIANIPFLGVMGVFAAIAVALAVVIALTLLPAMMGFLGERMRPRRRRAPGAAGGGRPARRSVFDRWVCAATRWPVATVAVLVVGLGLLALPASHLRMSLPNSGQHTAGQSDRITYDLVTDHFGPGYNGPLIITADLLPSNDPLGVMATLKKDVEATPGVARVLLSVPNQNADTGIVQVVPTTGPDDPATADLVRRITAQHDAWLSDPGVNTAVTGSTAIQIDVSERLGHALVPFGIFVVGLSTVLLMMVFRSLWVPVKATLGYLLSVVAAFGATQLVFNEGHLRHVVNLEKPLPIISFMPIVIMGILFGLAMDYEVFLVSRMREDYVRSRREHPDADHHDLARAAVRSGFDGSAMVVTAAAVIMFGVFSFFVPTGIGPIKQIAFGLAVGVAVDAFLVRMTLVPAVMQLLGARAWWLPRWLDRLLPSLDVEGEGLHHELELAGWPDADHRAPVHAEALAVDGLVAPVDLHLEPGQVAVVQGGPEARRALLLALSGRLAATSGRARVAGELLPLQAGRVRSATAVIDAEGGRPVVGELADALRRHPSLVLVDGADDLAGPDLDAVRACIRDLRDRGREHGTAMGRAAVIGVRDAEGARDWPADVHLRVADVGGPGAHAVPRRAVGRDTGGSGATHVSGPPVPPDADDTPTTLAELLERQ